MRCKTDFNIHVTIGNTTQTCHLQIKGTVIGLSDLDVVAVMKRKIFDWTGHAVRMDQARTLKKVKKVFESKPGVVEEGEDQDIDGWTMWRKIYGR
jgi:hypothetical protein